MLSVDHVRERLSKYIAAAQRDIEFSVRRLAEHPNALSTVEMPGRIKKLQGYIERMNEGLARLAPDDQVAAANANRLASEMENALNANRVDLA